MNIPSSPASNLAPRSVRGLMQEVARHAASVLFSTLAIQLTTFAVLALAGIKLTTNDFARLSLIVAATMLAHALFDLGLNVAATKMYGDTRDESYLRTGFAVRLLIVPMAAALGLAVAALTPATDIALAIGLGGLLTLWNGVRASDQARQDYRSLARVSFAFAGLRLMAGLLALFILGDPFAIAAAIYAVPLIAVPLSASFSLVTSVFSGTLRPVGKVIGYATYVYINSVAWVFVPYGTQFLMAARLDAEAVGTYGLILTFTAPISLLTNSLRNVLLPKVLDGSSNLENLIWSKAGITTIALVWIALALGGVVVGFALDSVFGQKYPDIGWAFSLFFAGFAASTTLGVPAVSVHTQGVPHMMMTINLIRLAAFVPLLLAFGWTMQTLILLTIATMIAGQAAILIMLARGRRP